MTNYIVSSICIELNMPSLLRLLHCAVCSIINVFHSVYNECI